MRETNCPECRWTTVVDSAGRRRLEMRWGPPTPAVSRPAAVSVRRAA
jgi:hypothetical protein